ncbi:MAG: nitrite reductase, copper-containing, partial [Roseitalea porphyridii]
VGETVLMVHNSCNVDSRPHLIGGHGNYVWETSFTDPPLTGVETWFVRGGCAAAAMYTFEQPGVYAYVNHNLIIAALKGATAH